MMNRTALAVAVLGFALSAGAQDSRSEKNVDTVVKAVAWKSDWDSVVREATEARKPVFWLNIVGDLDGRT